MLLLALDTSTSAITVALHDGERIRAASHVDVRGHAERLAPLIRSVLSEAGRQPGELTHVVAGEGPGPFTGLRVGLVTAETLAYAARARYAGVCSLDALAAAAVAKGTVGAGEFLVATDARRKEVYWATYALDGEDRGRNGEAHPAGALRRREGPAVIRPADLPEAVRSLPAVGRGAHLYPDLLPRGVGPLDVDAEHLAALALARLENGTLDVRERAAPLYLRRPDAAPLPPRPITPEVGA